MTSTLAHTSDSDWDNVTPGIWYGCLIIERPDGETDYVYAYSNVREYAPIVDDLCPDECKPLEATLLLTGHGKYTMRYESWAWDEQMGKDDDFPQTQDEYWGELESVDL